MPVRKPTRVGPSHAFIDRVMHLSTAHIPEELTKEVEHGRSYMDDIAYQEIRDYGWLCFADSEIDAMHYPKANPKHLDAVVKCYEFARAAGCTWLMFDCDAAIEPTLEKFEW